MKKIFYSLLIILAVSSCGVSQKGTKSNDRIVIGISRNGMTEIKKDNFRKCIADAGADIYFFPTYPETDEILQEYLSKVDAVIIPGSTKNDTTGRKKYDTRIIKAVIASGKPILGICEGHQRINQALGGEIGLVEKYYPESKVQHKIFDANGKNIGADMEAHSIKIDKSSELYKIFKQENMMVNTSHKWCTSKMSDKVKVVAVAEDGVVEAYEAPNVMGVQFHPEYMYAEMGLERGLYIFQYLVEKARKVKEGRK